MEDQSLFEDLTLIPLPKGGGGGGEGRGEPPKVFL